MQAWTATACFHTHRVSLFLNIQKAFELNVRRMEGNQQLDLKSDEAEKKGLSETSVYLSKNADAVDAPLLEPPQNEGIMSSEDSSENVKMDIAEESKEEVDSIGCCSCFSFNLFKGRYFRKCKVETADNEWNDMILTEAIDDSPCGAGVIDEFKKPPMVVDFPKPKGS
ncbi:Uncharacterized protein Fot_02283 [Forsythia ovata]|uniref:Uncharacterized protein n=1 Tax=Forsythia ovata TaxID=205694 RepID=A0ABD1X6G1_9LAMI